MGPVPERALALERGVSAAVKEEGAEAEEPEDERQRPQATLKGTETRSPIFRFSTSLPFSITSPVIS